MKTKQMFVLRAAISDVYSAGVNGIYFVGDANYASREREAVSNLDSAYEKALESLDMYGEKFSLCISLLSQVVRERDCDPCTQVRIEIALQQILADEIAPCKK